MRGETERQDARHQWQRDHQDPEPSTQRTWTTTREWCTRDPMCAQSSSQVLVVMICTPHRGSSLTCARHLMSIHVVCVSLRFELSIPSNFLFFSFILNLLHFLLHFLHNLEGSSNTAYFAWKEMDSTDESYLLTGHEWAQELRPHGDLCRVLHRVPDPPTVLRGTVPQGCGLRWHRAQGDAS